MKRIRTSRLIACGVIVVAAGLLAGVAVLAQQSTSAPAARSSQPEPAKDPLGRDTPRGTVLGFMDAARNARDDVAPLYLNTDLREQAAVRLARELFDILDAHLSARLNDLSDRPEGSLDNPLKPDQDTIATIATDDGPIDLVLERVSRGARGPVWLFSRKTLEAIPDLHHEVALVSADRFLPAFLINRRIVGVRLFAWLSLLLIVPGGYYLTGLLGLVARPFIAEWRRRRGLAGEPPANVVHGSVRLLLLVVLIHWLMSILEIRLPERVFWSGVSSSLLAGGLVWAVLMLNGAAERYILRRLRDAGRREVAAMLRLGRRVADVLAIIVAGLVMLRYVGFDPTAALAGLGIGGIAVALAAQKTLENVIGGISIIFDKAVRVGDSLKFGETSGTVDDIGLRSTRIRTLDRTIVSVPNGQIANANIETLSVRDKFWFHHFVGLRHDTTAAQMRSVVSGTQVYLAAHPMTDHGEAIRARFFRLGPFSLDIEVSAYVYAKNWDAFLETQQEMLLEIMGVVERSGAAIALPSQTLQLQDGGRAQQGQNRITRHNDPVSREALDAAKRFPSQ